MYGQLVRAGDNMFIGGAGLWQQLLGRLRVVLPTLASPCLGVWRIKGERTLNIQPVKQY